MTLPNPLPAWLVIDPTGRLRPAVYLDRQEARDAAGDGCRIVEALVAPRDSPASQDEAYPRPPRVTWTGRLPDPGLMVRTASKLGTPVGFGADVLNRRPDAEGVYRGPAPGTGGDVWLVRHLDGALACYRPSELAPLVER